MKNENILISNSKLIRDERNNSANSATRIGQMFLSIVEMLLGIFNDGIVSDNFTSGALGAGMCLKKDENGDWYLEVDRALFRKSATFVELIIQSLKHVGGQILLSPASLKCIKVEETDDTYKCYFKNDGSLSNEFEVDDLARRQTFNKTDNAYYWRSVVAVGDDYIELSKTDCDANSTIPQAGDDIVQIGNKTNTARQGAIMLDSSNTNPAIIIYKGINSYNLDGKEKIKLSPDDVRILADRIETLAENFKIRTKAGKDIAVFIEVDGMPMLNAECINAEAFRTDKFKYPFKIITKDNYLEYVEYQEVINITGGVTYVDYLPHLIISKTGYNIQIDYFPEAIVNTPNMAYAFKPLALDEGDDFLGAEVTLFNNYNKELRFACAVRNATGSTYSYTRYYNTALSPYQYATIRLTKIYPDNEVDDQNSWLLISSSEILECQENIFKENLTKANVYNFDKCVTVKSSDGKRYYQKWDNGFLICGGTDTGTWGRLDVKFLYPFKSGTVPISVNATVNTSEFTGYGTGYYNLGNTGMSLVSNKDYNKITFSWEAKGFWK